MLKHLELIERSASFKSNGNSVSPSLATNYIIKKSLKLFTSVVQKNNIDKSKNINI